MPTETLHFESARAAQQLYNNDPRNLQALADQLGVKATSREGWIKLDGESEALERVKHLFLVLENSIKAGTPCETGSSPMPSASSSRKVSRRSRTS